MRHSLPGSSRFRGGAVAALSGVAVWLAVAAPAMAQERVQFQPFRVNVITGPGARTIIMPLTMIVHTKTKKRAAYICSLAPRVRASLLGRMRATKFRQGADGKILVGSMPETSKAVVTKALRWDIVDRVEFVDGVPKIQTSSAQLFSRQGCIPMYNPESRGANRKEGEE